MNFQIDVVVFAQAAGEVLDAIGVVIILFGVVLATAGVVEGYLKSGLRHALYKSFRQNLGRAVLLGLEFLVAGDVIRTVASGNPTFDGVVALGIIVLIRTFLAVEFEMEIDGRWPWQGKGKEEN